MDFFIDKDLSKEFDRIAMESSCSKAYALNDALNLYINLQRLMAAKNARLKLHLGGGEIADLSGWILKRPDNLIEIRSGTPRQKAKKT